MYLKQEIKVLLMPSFPILLAGRVNCGKYWAQFLAITPQFLRVHVIDTRSSDLRLHSDH